MGEPRPHAGRSRGQACRLAALSQPDTRDWTAHARLRAQQRAVHRGRTGVAAQMLVQRTECRDRSAQMMAHDRHHLESLDVVRGISVAAMILVNNPGDWNSVFPSLLHADWNGWTFADVVFPFFVFV